LSKIVQRTTFSLWSELLTLPFVRFYVKQKTLQNAVADRKLAVQAAAEPAFHTRHECLRKEGLGIFLPRLRPAVLKFENI
jgi:hypothetical protein